MLTRAVKAAELAALVLMYRYVGMSQPDKATVHECIRRLALEIASQAQDEMPIIEGKEL